ncbi:MAG TPA: hypothetical protein VD968_05955 [Pyrinomonadaceae bacterium]|nr:hypothetical protein [Pyrinomonadaceae bacterium]
MLYNEGENVLTGWGPLLLPTVFVVLFNLLQRAVPTPTAVGLAALAPVLIAYFLFPRMRIRPRRVAPAVLLAVGVAVLMGALL